MQIADLPWAVRLDSRSENTLFDRCQATVLRGDMRFNIRSRCELIEGHAGCHAIMMGACAPMAVLAWGQGGER